ncbi:MAG TPA: ATP-binding protein [Azospirillaceae bacterium]|nr:ATP-binding protein [Azospirillaceae bacterium]
MSELVETLWRQYAVEANEHLDASERLLAQGMDVPAAERIGALFRAFHSLKGSSRAMDLFAIEKIAHHAETVLGRIRSGLAPLDEGTSELLVEAVDAVRVLVEVAVESRHDGTVPAGLLKRLEAAGDPDAHRPSGAALPPPTPVEKPRLHANERLLNLFVEHLREGMADLTRTLDLDSLDEDGARAVDETAERLEIGCERLSFLPFADTLRAFRAHLAGRDADALLADLQAVALASARVGRVSGKDAGTAILTTLLADHNAAALARGLARARELLEGAGEGGLAEVMDRVGTTLDVMRLPRATSLVRRIADAARSFGPEASPLWPEMLEPLRETLDLLASRATDRPSDLEAEAATRLEAAVRAYIDRASFRERDEDRPFTSEELAELGLDSDLLRFLSPESSGLLRKALADPGAHLAIVTAFLEGSPEIASRFVAWLGGRVQAITNWPDFSDGRAWMKVLVSSASDLPAMAAELRAIDPGGDFIRIAAPGGAVVAAPAVPAPEPTAPPVAEAPKPVEEAPRPAEAPKPAAAPAAAPPASPSSTQMLRVSSDTVDRFMAGVDRLVPLSGQLAARVRDTRLDRLATEAAARLGKNDPLARQLAEMAYDRRRALEYLDFELSRAIDQLRESALDLRVVPVETLFNQFPRVVRDQCRASGKRVRVAIDGGDVRIDKSTVEALSDPLLHMVRNAVDHGIESPEQREFAGKTAQGALLLRASQRNSRVLLEVADDGRGMSAEAIRLKAVRNGLVSDEASRRMSDEQIRDFIFAPGFSTADAVTETSGRGVGMDVVRDAVTRLGGHITIHSEPGTGTRFTIDLPLTASIVRSLLVGVDGQVMAIPDRLVEEVFYYSDAELVEADGRAAIQRRGRTLPLAPLSVVLGYAPPPPQPPGIPRVGVVLRLGTGRIALALEGLAKRADLFVRDSHPGLLDIPGVGGVSLLNDGRVVIVLDGDELFHLAARARVAELAAE